MQKVKVLYDTSSLCAPYQQIEESIQKWLDKNPSATVTCVTSSVFNGVLLIMIFYREQSTDDITFTRV